MPNLEQIAETLADYAVPDDSVFADRYRDRAMSRILTALRDAYAQGKGEREWQPIATAPKDGTPFIAANTMDAFRAFYDQEQEVWVCENDGLWFGALTHPPTHWMPLPAPPEDK